jgi:hypothetical protein
MQSGRRLQKLRRNVLLPSSVSESKPKKEPEGNKYQFIDYFLGLNFDPGGSTFCRKVCNILPDYTKSRPRSHRRENIVPQHTQQN